MAMEEELQKVLASGRAAIARSLEEDPLARIEAIYQLWQHWANFEIYIVSPTLAVLEHPLIYEAELIKDTNELEHVYAIHDHGYKLSTSKGLDMSGMSMCKLYDTIDKMVYLLLRKLGEAGVEAPTQVEIGFVGHELAKRKGFEAVINVNAPDYPTLVINNFDPGEWAEFYIALVKKMADKGYGYPPESPRSRWREPHGSTPSIGANN